MPSLVASHLPLRFCLSMTLLAALASPAALATICRVTPEGTGGADGSDWATNALALHAALAKPECIGPGNEIWVREGVYRPSSDTAFRGISFTVASGTQVFGGFAGTETLREERDPAAHLSILSGDIAGDDFDGDGDGVVADAADIQGENSVHVVFMDGAAGIGPDTVLDGLVITAGNALPVTPLDTPAFGGGLHCVASGAGAECGPRLVDLHFIGNSAYNPLFVGAGGGLACAAGTGGTCSPVIERSRFTGNLSNAGGGFALQASGGILNASISDSTFETNRAQINGGAGIIIAGQSSLAGSLNVTGTLFRDNEALSPTLFPNQTGGGALFAMSVSDSELDVQISDSAFAGNSAGAFGSGGALLTLASTSLLDVGLQRVSFTANNAGVAGGALISQSTDLSAESCVPPLARADLVVANSTFSGNQAAQGGAIEFLSEPDCTGAGALYNVTLAENTASADGGAIHYQSGGAGTSLALANAILWGNSADVDAALASSGVSPAASIDTSVVQGGCPASASCSGVVSNDPLLSPLSDHDAFGLTHEPGLAGSALDAGDETVCAGAEVGGVDQRGLARPQGSACDIGAIEFNFAVLGLDVTVSGPGSVDADTPPDPASGGIAACTASGGSCSASYYQRLPPGTIQLLATPGPGHHVEWGGDCAADGSVLMAGNQTCSASFVPNTWRVGGSISGLDANGLILDLNANDGAVFDALAAPSGSSAFQFDPEVPFGADYSVGIVAQPAGLVCLLQNASGTMPDADVVDVVVSCVTPPQEEDIFADGFE